MTAKNSNMEDYSRPDPAMSRRGPALLHRYVHIPAVLIPAILISVVLELAATVALAQYPGRITKPDKPTPTLRAIAVLEWVGDPAKPSASRLIPVSVFDGEELNDGAIYLNRPVPLALAGGTEYELQSGGRAVRLFDVFGSSQVFGAWQGTGTVKTLPVPETRVDANARNASSVAHGEDLKDADKPVLKRKNADDSGSQPPASLSSEESTAGQASSQGSGSIDPDRPTLHPTRKSKEAETLEGSNLPPDPDRPRLKHGKPANLEQTQRPRLNGLPPDLQQAVAVSDGTNRAEHSWKYTWANPDDERKIKQSLETIARTALGMDTPLATVQSSEKTAPQAASGHKKNSMLPPDPSPETAPETPALADENFRAFELSYGAAATLVLTAASPKPAGAADSDAGLNAKTVPQPDETPVIKRGKPALATEDSTSASIAPAKPISQKFVTLIAQPDLYGGILILYQSTTDSAHLGETPRMRLIDAVDALGDNQGELLFELRGADQRQFALYRILHGSAKQFFATVALPRTAIWP